LTNIYTIKDAIAGIYLHPIFERNDASAVRALREALANREHTFAKNPNDYTLYAIGTWDEETGEILGREPEAIINCALLVEKE
jgi:hypothetical protein